jgi:hypothetical protein
VNWDVSIALKDALIRVCSLHPWFVSSNNPIKHIFSWICILQDMLQGQTHSVHFFSGPSVLRAPTVCTLSETSNDHGLCCMPKYVNTLVQLLHYLSLYSCQLESALPPAGQLLLSQYPQGDLVGHHLQLSKALERISRPSCDLLKATNISHRKQEIFLYKYPLQRVLLPPKTHNRTPIFGGILLKHGRHFDYCNPPLNLSMLVCYLDCHESGLCCYLVIHIENLLRPL